MPRRPNTLPVTQLEGCIPGQGCSSKWGQMGTSLRGPRARNVKQKNHAESQSPNSINENSVFPERLRRLIVKQFVGNCETQTQGTNRIDALRTEGFLPVMCLNTMQQRWTPLCLNKGLLYMIEKCEQCSASSSMCSFTLLAFINYYMPKMQRQQGSRAVTRAEMLTSHSPSLLTLLSSAASCQHTFWCQVTHTLVGTEDHDLVTIPHSGQHHGPTRRDPSHYQNEDHANMGSHTHSQYRKTIISATSWTQTGCSEAQQHSRWHGELCLDYSSFVSGHRHHHKSPGPQSAPTDCQGRGKPCLPK